MKNLLPLTILFLLTASFTPPSEIIIPARTKVICLLTGQITLDDKPGSEVSFKVQQEVVVNGTTVIAKDAPVLATIRENYKPRFNNFTGEEMLGSLILDILSTKAVDGSTIKLNGCYLKFHAERNGNWFDKKRKWLIGEGTVKNCETGVDIKINVP